MVRHLPLIRLTVEHAYFHGRACEPLEFVASAATARLAARGSLLLRTSPGRFEAYWDTDRLDALRSLAAEPLTLGFKAYTRDAEFSNYTDPSCPTDRTPCFEIAPTSAGAGESGRRPHRGRFVSADAFEALASPRLEGILERTDRLVPPALVVRVRLDAEEVARLADPASTPDWTIAFDARRTYWRYLVHGDLARADVRVADPSGEIDFDLDGERDLPGGRTAAAFRSRSPILLEARSERRFQLRRGEAGNGKVLIKRLPVPSAGQLVSEEIDGTSSMVSEIYVYF